MAQLTATLTLQKIDKPAGRTPGPYRFVLTRTGGSSAFGSYIGDETTYTFANVPPGDYTLVAERRDSAGSRLGDVVSTTISVPASVPGAEQIDVPASIVITLA